MALTSIIESDIEFVDTDDRVAAADSLVNNASQKAPKSRDIETASGDIIHLPSQYVSDDWTWNDDKYTVRMSYHFPAKPRNNKVSYFGKGGKLVHATYGSKMTFQDLYELLCNACNDGERFIDAYFRQFHYFVEGRSSIKRYTAEVLNEVISQSESAIGRMEKRLKHRTKSGRPDKRYAEYQYFTLDAAAYFSEKVKGSMDALSYEIKDDIIQRLARGEIWLRNPMLAEDTIKKKARMGFSHPGSKFFATGQLIHSISIDFYLIGNNEEAV